MVQDQGQCFLGFPSLRLETAAWVWFQPIEELRPCRGWAWGKDGLGETATSKTLLSTGHTQVRRAFGVPSFSPASGARAPPWAGGHETRDFNLVCACAEHVTRTRKGPFLSLSDGWGAKKSSFVQNLARIFCMLVYWLLVEGFFWGQTSWREQNWLAMLLWTGHHGNKAFGLLFSVY